jgi:ribokinase
MPARICVVGSANIDLLVKVPRLPRPGETVLGGQFASAPGGKGANQAVAAARAGGDVAFIACVGQDAFGAQAIAGYQADEINVAHVRREPATPTGVGLIFVDAAGENCIAVASGANARLSPADVTAARAAIEQAVVLVLQLENPLETVRAAAALAHEAGVRVLLNPAPATVLEDGLWGRVSVITPNEHEAATLTGVRTDTDAGVAEAARRLRARGVATVLITLGARGVYLLADDYEGLVTGYTVDAVDTTAAGDVFNGALAVALAEGRPLRDAVRFASAAAAISVTRLGAQPSAPRRAEIESFLRART